MSESTREKLRSLIQGSGMAIKRVAIDTRNVVAHEWYATVRNYYRDPEAGFGANAGVIIALTSPRNEKPDMAKLTETVEMPEIFWWLSNVWNRQSIQCPEALDELCLAVAPKYAKKIVERYPDLELPQTRLELARRQLDNKIPASQAGTTARMRL